MGKNSYILAMYDVRGKQNYIFHGRKLKEIAGASLVIRDIFKDELYPAAKKYKYRNETGAADEKWLSAQREAIYVYDKNESENFTREGFEQHLREGYLGEVVYDGGGNFFILYRDKDTYIGINKIFTKNVMEHTYSLTVLCSSIEGVDFDHYPGDRDKLYLENRKREARINPQVPAQVLPFTQVNYADSLPLYKYDTFAKAKLTRESCHKYRKFKEEEKNSDGINNYNEKFLDNIASEKGSDSWIAAIYIDGNNMGAKVQKLLAADENYETAIRKLRSFSNEIQKNYVEDRLAAIDKVVSGERRFVIYAGDEINIILNAHDAYKAVKAYFEGMPQGCSSCAGIAIFKSHMPYTDAYNIAEQCCENAKRYMKDHKISEGNLVDFHYCQGVIGLDLEKIREREVGDLISKPWFVSSPEQNHGNLSLSDIVTCDMVEELVRNLNTCTRTNIKGLLQAAKEGESFLYTELTRMQLRRKNAQKLENLTDAKCMNGEKMSNAQLRKLIYDIVSVYDLWFRGRERC